MNRIGRLALWAFILAALLGQQLLMRGYTMDDAFISFRYARNVAQGEGWVYNPGSEPVEGFTNFLWTALLVPVFRLGLEPMPAAQALGMACSVIVIFLAFRLTWAGVSHPRGWLPFWTPVFLIVTGAFVYHAVTGLETHLFTLGLTAGVYFFLKRSRTGLALSSFFFLIATLTRPEGLPLFIVSLLFLIGWWSQRDEDFSSLLLFVLLYAIPLAVFLLWRHRTFGQWLPNTYWAKSGPVSERLPEGALYVWRFFSHAGALIPWFACFIPLLWYRLRPRELYLTLMSLVFLAGVVWEGGDWMPLHRMLSPALPLLFVLVVEAMDVARELWSKTAAVRGMNPAPVRLLCVAWLGATLAALWYPSMHVIREAMVRPELYQNSQVALGLWLKGQCKNNEPVALADIGQIGYYSELPVIDLAGLTDRTIAQSPGGLHRKEYDPEYVLDRQPEFVVLVCARVGGRMVIRGFETDKRLYHHPRFQREYRLLPEISQRFHYKDDYSYWVFQRIPSHQAG